MNIKYCYCDKFEELDEKKSMNIIGGGTWSDMFYSAGKAVGSTLGKANYYYENYYKDINSN